MAQGDLYSVASGLQAILARRKAEEQLAIQNQMKQKELESDIAYKKSLAESQDEYRRAIADQRENDTVLKWLGQFKIGDDLSSADPSLLSLAEKRGFISPENPNPTPSVSTGTEIQGMGTPEGDQSISQSLAQPPATPPKQGKFFKGLAPEREQQRMMEAYGGLITSGALTDPKMDVISKLLMLQQASGKPLDLTDISNVMKEQASERDAFVLDEQTGNITPALGPDGKPIRTRAASPFLERNRPAASAQVGPSMQPFQGTDAQGRPVYFGYDPRANKFVPSEVPPNTAIGGRAPTVPSNNRRLSELLTPVEQTKLTTLKTQVERQWANGRARAELSNYVTSLMTGMERKLSDPSVLQAVKDVLKVDSQAKAAGQPLRPLPEIMAEFKANSPDMTPAEAMELEGLLELFRLKR